MNNYKNSIRNSKFQKNHFDKAPLSISPNPDQLSRPEDLAIQECILPESNGQITGFLSAQTRHQE